MLSLLMLADVLAHRVARRPLAEQALEHALHLGQRQPLLQPPQLNGERAQLVDEDALLGEIEQANRSVSSSSAQVGLNSRTMRRDERSAALSAAIICFRLDASARRPASACGWRSSPVEGD